MLNSKLKCNWIEETNNPVQQKTQSSRKTTITEQEWDQIEALYNECYRETPVIQKFSAEQRSVLMNKFSQFKTSYQDLFTLPKNASRLQIMRQTRTSLESYAFVLMSMYSAFESLDQIVNREAYIDLYNRELKKHFLIFQHITNTLFEFACANKVLKLDKDEDVIKLDKFSFAYFKDSNGFVPMPYKKKNEFWMSSSVW